MTRVGVRSPGGPFFGAFDGQSLNLTPTNTYPIQTMSGLGIPWQNVAVTGLAWDELDDDVDERLFPLADLADVAFHVMCGGTAHVNRGDTGAEYYAAEVAYAEASRAAGFSIIINTTLVPSTTFIQAGEEEARLDANELKLANAGGTFDAVVDLCSDPVLNDATSAAYVDGTHWNFSGAQRAKNLVRPVVLAELGL